MYINYRDIMNVHVFVLDIVPVDKNNYDGQLGGIFGITVKTVYA